MATVSFIEQELDKKQRRPWWSENSGGFRGVSEVSTEPPFGLHLVVRSTDDRLTGTPLFGYRTKICKKTAALAQHAFAENSFKIHRLDW